MLDLYNMGPRVRYGDFCQATVALVRGVIQTYGGGNNGVTINFQLGMFSGETAAVACQRDIHGYLRQVSLSMPAHLPDTIVSGDFAKTLLGFLIHEIGHVMLTDTSATANAKKLTGSKAGADFINVVEDYFIEHKMPDPASPMLGNAGALLGRLNDEVQQGLERGMFDARKAKKYTRQGFLLLLASLNRSGRQGAAMDEAHQYCRAQCAPEVLAIVSKLMDELDNVAASATPRDCVRRTGQRGQLGVEAWEALAKLDANKPQGDEGPEGKRPEGGQPMPTPEGARVAQLLAKGPQSTPAQQAAAAALAAQTLGGKSPVMPKPHSPGASGARAAMLAREANVALLADAARRALKSVDSNSTAHRLAVGRLDRRALVRARMGAKDVFQRRTFSPGVRTAVMLMVDMSTSMESPVTINGSDYSRALASIAMASAMIPALERAQVQVGVGLFSDGLVHAKRFKDRMPDPSTFAMASACTPWGGTPMLPAAYWAESQLLAERLPTRRVVIWLCDGVPNEGADAVRTYATRTGNTVEHIGIGLGCDLSGCFASSAKVQDMAGLPTALMEALT